MSSCRELIRVPLTEHTENAQCIPVSAGQWQARDENKFRVSIMPTKTDKVVFFRKLQSLHWEDDPVNSANLGVVRLARTLIDEVYSNENVIWPRPQFYIACDNGVEIVWKNGPRKVLIHISPQGSDREWGFLKVGDGNRVSSNVKPALTTLSQELDWVAQD